MFASSPTPGRSTSSDTVCKRNRIGRYSPGAPPKGQYHKGWLKNYQFQLDEKIHLPHHKILTKTEMIGATNDKFGHFPYSNKPRIMKKLIIALFASFLFYRFAYSVSEPEIPIPTDPTGGETRKAEVGRPAPNPFPPRGKPPAAQTKDMRPLPGGFGMGSSTLARWIGENLAKDKADGKDPEKPKSRRPEQTRFPAHWGRPPEIQTADPLSFPVASEWVVPPWRIGLRRTLRKTWPMA